MTPATSASLDYVPSLRESWSSDKDWIKNMQSIVGKVSTAVAPTPIERLVK